MNVFAAISQKDLTMIIEIFQRAVQQQRQLQRIERSVALTSELDEMVSKNRSVAVESVMDLVSKNFSKDAIYGKIVAIDELSRLAYNDYADAVGKPDMDLLRGVVALESREL